MTDETIGDQSGLATLLLRLAQKCAACVNGDDFAALVRDDVRRMLPHRSLIAVLGRIDLEHLELLHVEAVDYPAHGVKALQRVTNLRNRPALMHWLSHRKPIVLDPELDGHHMSVAEQREIEHLQLGRVAAHGVLDLIAKSGSYFSFGGVPREICPKSLTDMLSLLVPHLHQSLLTCHRGRKACAGSIPKLAMTERQIMRWVAAGRTNAEIAKLRGRSEATVRNQLTITYRKLGVTNRAAAVRLQEAWT